MSDEMEEIIAEFVTEAEEALERTDPLFVELETKKDDIGLVDEIFRTMHTLKGAASFLGFQQIVDIAHKSENVLKKLRDRELSVSTAIIDVILRSADTLKVLLRKIRLKDDDAGDTSALLADLDAALCPGGPLPEGQDTVAHQDAPGQPGSAVESVNPPAHGEESAEARGKAPAAVAQGGPAAADRTAGQVSVKDAVQTLRISVERVDKVMDLTGEIVLVRNRLVNLVNYLEMNYADDGNVASLLDTVSFLDLVTADMQLAVMRMRMQPLRKVFGKFPRLVRDLSNGLGKEVSLVVSGEDTEVDRSIIEHIGDPMVHIIRNSIDHGMEMPDERNAKGKETKGTISINAFQQGNQIIIEVADDGRGVDIEKVKTRAVQNGLISGDEAMRMTDENAINLIFLPGFSTAEFATEFSGRGVGMDVVKTNISRLNGYVEVTSRKGKGTTFRISVPLTLAIIQALMVGVAGDQYAIPLAPIEETLKVSRSVMENVAGQKVIVVRDRVCPVFELSDILGSKPAERNEQAYVIVIAIGERRFCIAVDELLGQEEVVIKTIDGIDADASSIVGATITGEGRVVLILDLAGISRNVIGALRV